MRNSFGVCGVLKKSTFGGVELAKPKLLWTAEERSAQPHSDICRVVLGGDQCGEVRFVQFRFSDFCGNFEINPKVTVILLNALYSPACLRLHRSSPGFMNKSRDIVECSKKVAVKQ